MGVYDKYGNSLVGGVDGRVPKQTVDVLVASSEASASVKETADYVCSGTNDELIIQQAVNYVANNLGGKVRLSEGRFYIGSFPSASDTGNAAILVPQTNDFYSIEIIGAALPYDIGFAKLDGDKAERGTLLYVTDSCYSALSANSSYTVIEMGRAQSGQTKASHIHITLSDFSVFLPYNQKKITCINVQFANRCLIERVEMKGVVTTSEAYQNGGLAAGVEGCVGLRCLGGTNNGVLADFRNMLARDFYEGFKLAGEHVIGINLSAIHNVYGYTFGNYNWTAYSTHPITLINCCDERGVNLPLFVANGTNGGTTGKQAVTLIDFNIERNASASPTLAVGDYAKETTPGTFYGSIEYTITSNYNTNDVNIPFWATDGSGINMKSRNQAQAMIGTSAVRRTYAPNYCQQYYDTDVGKMLFCINPASKTWVDAEGNTVA